MTAPAQPNRRSVRLKDYDYRTAGGYFITICTHDREPLFADPRTARIVNAAWDDIPSHHAHVEIDEFVVMPNHLHGILFLGHLTWKNDGRSRLRPYNDRSLSSHPVRLARPTRGRGRLRPYNDRSLLLRPMRLA